MPSRRALLATCASTGASAVLAGCSDLRGGSEPDVDAAWPQRGRDGTRTGTRSSGPAPPLTDAWTYDGDAGFGGIDCSPVLADGRVYLAYTADRSDERAAVVDAIDAATGERRWSTTAATTAEPIQRTHAYADSLAVAGDAVLLQTATGLVALEVEDGSERWHVDNVGDGQLGSTPVHPGVGDGVVFAGYYRHGRSESRPLIYAIDLEEGAERFRFEIDWDERLVYAPAVRDGVVYAAVAGGGVKAIDAADGTERWSERLPVYGVPAVTGESVFVGVDGDPSGVVALSTDTGERRWSRTDGSESTVPFGVAVADGTVYYAAMDRLVARDAATGERRWTTGGQGSERIFYGAPVVGGDYLYGTGSSLFAADRATGELQWQGPDGWTVGSPALADDLLYVSLEHGTLAALSECRTELFGRCLR
ncbi:PQQ-binding-like beta-propeller repeat protein [Natronobacterium lacisalsi]|nr:PQQ-binding-like beta-propeller repeat protein [Halobiforma lacisalsi]